MEQPLQPKLPQLYDPLRDIWKTQDGREIPIPEMSFPYLISTFKMLKRKGFVSESTLLVYLLGPEPRGEMAQYA